VVEAHLAKVHCRAVTQLAGKVPELEPAAVAQQGHDDVLLGPGHTRDYPQYVCAAGRDPGSRRLPEKYSANSGRRTCAREKGWCYARMLAGTCAAHSIKLEPQAPRRFLPVASLDVAACLIGGYAEKVESVLGNCDNLWREKRRWAREGED
jgi:hypothetical protein